MDNINNLINYLLNRGYKQYPVYDTHKDYIVFKTLLQKPFDTESKCECNEHVCVNVHITKQHFISGTIIDRAEISITSKLRDKWWNINCYSLTPEEAIIQFDDVEETLIKLFNTI